MAGLSLAPVVLFVYNRLWHTQQTVHSLLQNPLASQSQLYIFSDGPKNEISASKVQEVREYIRTVRGFKEMHIIESKTNKGLANSIIAGVTQVIHQYGKVIVMEDDMRCATNYLAFMNDCLNQYQHHPDIFAISGYTAPIPIPDDFTESVFLLPRPTSWGWATWADRWCLNDWEMQDYNAFMQDKAAQKAYSEIGEDLIPFLKKQKRGLIDSWAIRWSYTLFKNKAYCVYPVRSKIQNIGNDQSGTHSPSTQKYHVQIDNSLYTLPDSPRLHPEIYKNYQAFYKLSPVRKIINYFTLR